MFKPKDFSLLIGKTLSNVENRDGKEIIFIEDNGKKWSLCHEQDCCETVSVEDICGDLKDLIGVPIVMAEEISSRENPEGVTKKYQDSFTWTFYKLATIKGYVTIRWYGESNGYYSESVSFIEL